MTNQRVGPNLFLEVRVQLSEVFAVLRARKAALIELGVGSIAVFGSVARGEAGPCSDVDLLVEFNRPMDLFQFVDIRDALSVWLGCRVDLVPKGSILPRIRERVLREAVDAA